MTFHFKKCIASFFLFAHSGQELCWTASKSGSGSGLVVASALLEKGPIYLSHSQDNCANGYHNPHHDDYLNGNLVNENVGGGGKDTFLCVAEDLEAQGITGLALVRDSNWCLNNNGWNEVYDESAAQNAGSLNHSSGGRSTHLCYSTNKELGRPINEISLDRYLTDDVHHPQLPDGLVRRVLEETSAAAQHATYITFSRSVKTLATGEPTSLPTSTPTSLPTSDPTSLPTSDPTSLPTSTPTSLPTSDPTSLPTSDPTSLPTSDPSSLPTIGIPTQAPTPEVSLQASVNGDPHYKMWGDRDSLFYDYQGDCEQILVDNKAQGLQVQVKTTDFGYFSSVTQIVFVWKSKVVFHFDGASVTTNDGLVTNNVATGDFSNTMRYRKTLVSNDNIRHRFFFGEKNEHFIEVNQHSTIPLDGVNLMRFGLIIKASSSIFGGSKGLLGSWDESGKMYYRDGTLYDNHHIFDDANIPIGKIGNDIRTSLVQSWKIDKNLHGDTNHLNNPTNVCKGPNERRRNMKDDRNLQGLAPSSCGYSCSDIKHPLMKHFCEIDVNLTNDPEWACEASYLDPVLADNDVLKDQCEGGSCKVCPKSCKGDASTTEKFSVTIDGITKKHYCKWAVRKIPEMRCAIPEVALNCCETCCGVCTGDAAGSNLFEIPERGPGFVRGCHWVGQREDRKAKRCALPTVARMCCMTCSS